MINKKLEEITLEDLENLIVDSVLEGRTIEYKSKLNIGTRKEKITFLAHVSSFANTVGGDLIIGIRTSSTQKSKPESIDGIEIDDIDKTKNRISNFIRDNIQPRIPDIKIKEIHLQDQRYVIIIRINRSFILPHRVSHDGHDKFYMRSTAGKYPMSVDELRIAFDLGKDLSERIGNFKLERLSQISINELPVEMIDSAKITIHIIPYSSFNFNQYLDIELIEHQGKKLATFNNFDTFPTYTLKGYLRYERDINGDITCYSHLYRSGKIEILDIYNLRVHNEDLKIKDGTYLEKKFIKVIESNLQVLKELNIPTPVVIFISLLGVKDYVLSTRTGRPPSIHDTLGKGFKENIIQLPEIILNDYETNIKKVTKLPFDTLWNANGWKRSPNFENNLWVEKGHFT